MVTPEDLLTPAVDLQWTSVYVPANCRGGFDGNPTWLSWQWPDDITKQKKNNFWVNIPLNDLQSKFPAHKSFIHRCDKNSSASTTWVYCSIAFIWMVSYLNFKLIINVPLVYKSIWISWSVNDSHAICILCKSPWYSSIKSLWLLYFIILC